MGLKDFGSTFGKVWHVRTLSEKSPFVANGLDSRCAADQNAVWFLTHRALAAFGNKGLNGGDFCLSMPPHRPDVHRLVLHRWLATPQGRISSASSRWCRLLALEGRARHASDRRRPRRRRIEANFNRVLGPGAKLRSLCADCHNRLDGTNSPRPQPVCEDGTPFRPEPPLGAGQARAVRRWRTTMANRRSSSASDLTRCKPGPVMGVAGKMDWGGTSRLPPLSSPRIARTTYSRSFSLPCLGWTAPPASAWPPLPGSLARLEPALGVQRR